MTMTPNAMVLPADTVRQIETLAMRAWPARVVEPLHGWQMTFTDGLTRRINSVQPMAWQGGDDLSAALDTVERFYTERGLPARFRLTAVSAPDDLDRRLAERGYEVEAATDVLVVDAATFHEPTPDHEVMLALSPPSDWLTFWLAGLSREEAQKRGSLIGRLPPTTVFALAWTDNQPAGVAFAAVEPGWAGIFAMQTAERFRGRGVAGALLGALAERVRVMGADRMYLQVEQDNAAAQRLYRRTGFTSGYGYHYRTRRVGAPG